MTKKILFALWIFSLVFEIGLTVGGFLAPRLMLHAFHVGATADTLFLAHVLAWCFFFVSAVNFWIVLGLKAGRTEVLPIAQALCIWWIALGPALYFKFGRVESLFMDTLKGCVLIFLIHSAHPKERGKLFSKR